MGHVARRRERERLLPAIVPEMDGWQTLGRKVREERRTVKRWSQKELARRAGISRTTLAKLEAGTPTPDSVIAIEEALTWEPGSIREVMAGRPPIYEVDPDMAHLTALWTVMDVRDRNILLAVAEVLSRTTED